MKRTLPLIIILALVFSCTALAGCPVYGGDHVWNYTGIGDYPTCTTEGWEHYECDCGAEKTAPMAALGHAYKMVDVTLPTCTENGYVYLKCSRCGAKAKQTNPAYGHAWQETGRTASTCAVAGSASYRCTECGAVTTKTLEKEPHAYGEWVVTEEASSSAPGTKERRCETCGYVETDVFYSENTLMRGDDRREYIRIVQQQLIDLGYLNDTADGIFGRKTEEAVKAFQEAMGLEVTGIAFDETLERLQYEHNVLTGVIDRMITDGVHACRFDEENGLTLCDRHNGIEIAGAALLAAADTDERKIAAYEKIRDLWKAEADELYEGYCKGASVQETERLMEEQAMMAVERALAEKLLAAEYADDPLTAAKLAAEGMKEECCRLCGVFNAE